MINSMFMYNLFSFLFVVLICSRLVLYEHDSCGHCYIHTARCDNRFHFALMTAIECFHFISSLKSDQQLKGLQIYCLYYEGKSRHAAFVVQKRMVLLVLFSIPRQG